MGKKAAKRRKKAEASSRGLTARQAIGGEAPARVQQLAEAVEQDGGAVAGTWRDPLGGNWQLLCVLPVEKVEPTPYQRDLSEAHWKRLAQRLEELERFLDPIIVVRRAEGGYWTPNGNHRLAAMRALGARAITALLVPEEDLAYRILALNTEKAHNLREKALEVIRMARDLATLDPKPERDYAAIFEEPLLLTLGSCYEQRGRFPGSVYQPVLRRVDSFQAARLDKALTLRADRAARLLELEDAVSAAAAALKERGFESPYLKNFVVARVNPLRFQKEGKEADFDATIDKMLASAKAFDTGKVKADQLARTGGAPEE